MDKVSFLFRSISAVLGRADPAHFLLAELLIKNDFSFSSETNSMEIEIRERRKESDKKAFLADCVSVRVLRALRQHPANEKLRPFELILRGTLQKEF